jgi:hypothetical protein
MTYELTNEEKIEIVTQHIKNLNLSLYNLQISLKEEEALDNPNENIVSSLNQQINDTVSKKVVITTELNSLKE